MKMIKKNLSKDVLSQKDMAKYWVIDRAKKYTKQGTVKARRAVEGETIETVIDGVKETTNTAKLNDIVVTGIKGEQYILSVDQFIERYSGPSVGKDDQEYECIGSTYAIQWNGRAITFEASWGETMILNRGDFLCSTDLSPNFDLYRIEKEIFAETYKAAEEE